MYYSFKIYLEKCISNFKFQRSMSQLFSAVDFFNQINMLYGTITEFCTEDKCPVMSAGPKYEYHWADGTTVKKPIKCSAPKYIDYLMSWVQDQLDDENLFPSKIGKYSISVFKKMNIEFDIYECCKLFRFVLHPPPQIFLCYQMMHFQFVYKMISSK